MYLCYYVHCFLSSDLQSLTNKKVTADHATSLLDTMFSKSKKQDSIVLLVDEVDYLYPFS